MAKTPKHRRDGYHRGNLSIYDNENFYNKNPKESNFSRHKIHKTPYGYSSFSLSNRWLKTTCGFNPGDEVMATYKFGILTITKINTEGSRKVEPQTVTALRGKE